MSRLTLVPAFLALAMVSGSAMAQGHKTLLAHFKVADYAEWLPVFETGTDYRAASTITNARIYRNSADGNDILVLFDVGDESKARASVESDETRKDMQQSGVQGRPRVDFLR
jgi:hypothetical protein